MHGTWRSVAVGFVVAAGLSAGAMAGEPETVQVDGDGLSGIWKFAGPESVMMDFTGTVHFGPMLDRFCRMERGETGFVAHCIGWDFRNFQGEGSLSGRKVHLAGGFILLRFVIDGELVSPTEFTGIYAVKVMGIRVDDPEVAKGGKVVITPGAPDATGFGAALRTAFAEIADSTPGTLPIAAASKRADLNPEPLTAQLTQTLGAVETVSYLGDAPRPHGVDGKPAAGHDIAIYDVEFAHGERLCAVDRMLGVASGIVCT